MLPMNVYNSREFQFLLDLLTLLKSEGKATKRQLRTLQARNRLDSLDSLEPLLSAGLLLENNGVYSFSEDLSFFRPTPDRLQLDYLRDILSGEEARLFLTEGEIEALGGGEKSPFISRKNAAGKGDGPDRYDSAVFLTLLEGIVLRRRVRHTWRTRDDAAERVSVLVPYRFEYQVYDGRWWVIFYSEAEDRTIKARLEHILSARLEDGHCIDEETIRAAILRHASPEPLVLRIEDRKNAVERTFIAFDDVLDREGERLDSETYQMTIRYLDFHEEEIIKKLMYLGECVTVVSPKRIKTRLVERIKDALKLYNDN